MKKYILIALLTAVVSFAIAQKRNHVATAFERPLDTAVLSSDSIDLTTLKVYPNPCFKFVTIQGISGEVTMYDVIGNIILKVYVDQSRTIDLSNQKSGIYFIRMKDDIVKIILK